MAAHDEMEIRAREYAVEHSLVVLRKLGSGKDGVVFATQSRSGETAIKAFGHDERYQRERDVYLRLKKKKIKKIRSCHVPKLIAFDDALLVIEMTVVKRPFVLDFAGAYLDHAPDFSEEVMADWYAERSAYFGKHWPEVLLIKAVLETLGIYMEDIHLGNISFADTPFKSSSSS